MMACAPCCSGSGGGSGDSGSGVSTVLCPNGTCVGIPVSTSLILSVNAIQLSTLLGDPPYSDNLARFVGDFPLTYIADEVTQRDVDEFCEDANVSISSEWFSELIDCTDLSPGGFFRYMYNACTGTLSFIHHTQDGQGCYLNEDWPPKDEYYVRLPEPFITTLDISDCNYFADAAETVFTGSVSTP